MTDNSTQDISTGDDNRSASDQNLTVLAGLTEKVIDLETVSPEIDLKDISALRKVFADRRIVGLGEASHGAKEFSQLKHRLLRFLVKELGIRLLALEAHFSPALAVDRYVRQGKGDSETALGGLYSWPWMTDDMLALIEWLRAFNTDRRPQDQVRFYGLDMQHTEGVADDIMDYLDRVDPEYLATVREDLAVLADPGLQLPKAEGRAERLAAGDRVVPDLRTTLEERRADYIVRSSERDWELARQHVTVLGQAIELGTAAHTGDELINEEVIRLRDRAMAENIEWVLRHESADRIVVWAHNDHINKVETTASGHSAASMGRHLARWYDSAYYSIGFDFGRGTFQAYVESEAKDWGYEVQECNLDDPLPATVASLFTALDHQVAFLDFQTAKTDPRLVDWLNGKQRLHCIGTAYDRERPKKHVQSYVLAEAFDGLCYMDETTKTLLYGKDFFGNT